MQSFYSYQDCSHKVFTPVEQVRVEIFVWMLYLWAKHTCSISVTIPPSLTIEVLRHFWQGCYFTMKSYKRGRIFQKIWWKHPRSLCSSFLCTEFISFCYFAVHTKNFNVEEIQKPPSPPQIKSFKIISFPQWFDLF